METLIERYLHTVRAFLPKAQQDDIIRELRENLNAQLEDREESLGRKLTDAEIGEILRAHGHPLLVASRYRAHSALIGPMLLPFFWVGVRLVVILAAILAVISSIPKISLDHFAGTFVSAVVSLPIRFLEIGLPLFGLLTLSAIVVEVCQVKFQFWEKWRPEDLPVLKRNKDGISMDAGSGLGAMASLADLWNMSDSDWWNRTKEGKKRYPDMNTHRCGHRPGRFSALGELFGQGFMIAWWILIPTYPWLIFGPASTLLQLSPIWAAVHQSVLTLLFIGLALRMIPVIVGQPRWLGALVDVITGVLGLFIIKHFMTGEPLLLVTNPEAHADLARVVSEINRYAPTALVVISVFITIKLLCDAIRLFWRIRVGGADASPTT